MATSDGEDAGLVFLPYAERYRPPATPSTPMRHPRRGHTATTLPDGRILVAGGQTDDTVDSERVAVAEIFDPTTGTFIETGALVVPRQGHQAVLLGDGRVLVVGGDTDGPARAYQQLASAEIYDPSTGRWRATGGLAHPRLGHTATVLLDGRVLVACGCGSACATSVEAFEPRTETWAPAADMLSGRTREHTATVLRDGRVLVVGGLGGVTP